MALAAVLLFFVLSILESLHEHGTSQNFEPSTPLSAATPKPYVSPIQDALSVREGMTPLLCAVFAGDAAIIQLLAELLGFGRIAREKGSVRRSATRVHGCMGEAMNC